MKRFLYLFISFSFVLLITGCNDSKSIFSFEEEYYGRISFEELSLDSLNHLLDDKKSFGLFIYQPLCASSVNFNKVLTEFSNTYKIGFYKMPFDELKQSKIGEYVKYYPSFIIIHNGEIVDFLDANNNEDSYYYNSVDEFKDWFSSYVLIKNVDDSVNNKEIELIYDEMKVDEKLDDIVYNDNKVNIYFFWGNGCPHCEEEFKFFNSISTEYGDYFSLNTFEVWYNTNNFKILEDFASKMGDEISGVPYTVIGNKTFSGFSISYEKEFLQAIESQYLKSYDVYLNS